MKGLDTVQRIYIILIVLGVTMLLLLAIAVAVAAWIFSGWGATDL